MYGFEFEASRAKKAIINFKRSFIWILHFITFSVIYSLLEFFRKQRACERSPGRHPKKLAVTLTAIFNLSISSGIFPDLWKTAKVSPPHKGGSLFDRSNYRPISVMAVVSKILQRHVHQTFYYFLSQQELLLDSQFVFCSLAHVSLLSPIFLTIF